MTDYGYTYELDQVLEHLELTLAERWQGVVYDCLLNREEIPQPLSGRGALWEHRTPEVWGHINYGNCFGGCAYLNWWEGGRVGDVRSITCAGKIREDQHVELRTIDWYGAEVKLPLFTECRIGELFAAAEEWSFNDRKMIADQLPPFAAHNLTALRQARDALVAMAGAFGAASDGTGAPEDPSLQTSLTLTDTVDLIFVDRDREKDWMVEWTGAAADRVANGVFASTKPTLFNHAIIANGLGTLINERATIIHTYQQNSLGLVRSATASLKATETETTDLVPGWKVVQGLGMSLSIVPQAAPVGAAISLVGWLGEQFLKETKNVTFSVTPHEAAKNLYDAVIAMDGGLATSEAAYAQDVLEFRNALNAVPSTFLELYDTSENKA